MPPKFQDKNEFGAVATASASVTLDTILQGLRGWMYPDGTGTTPRSIFDVVASPIGLTLAIPATGSEPSNVRITTQALANGQGLLDSNDQQSTAVGTVAFQKWRVAQGGSFVPGEFMFIGLTTATLHSVFLTMPPIGAQQTVGFLVAAPPQANFIAISGDGAGNAASADTGVAVDTLFHTFEMKFRGAAGVVNQVDFYIDGTLVTSINTALPAASALTSPVFYAQGNARTMFFSYMWMGLKV